MIAKIFKWLPGLLSLAAVIYLVTHVTPLISGEVQHDFRTYYYSTKAYYGGLNPYDLESLQAVSGNSRIDLPMTYPPHFFFFFQPLTLLDYTSAYYLFLAVKLAALAALIVVWTRIIPIDKRSGWLLWVTLVLGYRSAVFRDVKAGNISVFEQLFIWTGIWLLLRGRTLFGGIGILLSATFKIITLSLVPLMVIVNRSWRVVSLAIMLLSAAVATFWFLYSTNPVMWMGFGDVIRSLQCRGNTCPSSLALIGELAGSACLSDPVVYFFYSLLCLLVFSVLLWAYWITRKTKTPYPMLYLTLIGYVLLAPRMKDYSLVIALLPTLHTVCALPAHRWQKILGLLLLWVPLVRYQALLTAGFTFWLLVHWIWINRFDARARMPISLYRLDS